jgi:hypothetical protein
MSDLRLPSAYLQTSNIYEGRYSMLSRQELAGRGSDLDLGTNMPSVTIFSLPY